MRRCSWWRAAAGRASRGRAAGAPHGSRLSSSSSSSEEPMAPWTAPVGPGDIGAVCEGGTMAPSGGNNGPAGTMAARTMAALCPGQPQPPPTPHTLCVLLVLLSRGDVQMVFMGWSRVCVCLGRRWWRTQAPGAPLRGAGWGWGCSWAGCPAHPAPVTTTNFQRSNSCREMPHLLMGGPNFVSVHCSARYCRDTCPVL